MVQASRPTKAHILTVPEPENLGYFQEDKLFKDPAANYTEGTLKLGSRAVTSSRPISRL